MSLNIVLYILFVLKGVFSSKYLKHMLSDVVWHFKLTYENSPPGDLNVYFTNSKMYGAFATSSSVPSCPVYINTHLHRVQFFAFQFL